MWYLRASHWTYCAAQCLYVDFRTETNSSNKITLLKSSLGYDDDDCINNGECHTFIRHSEMFQADCYEAPVETRMVPDSET